MSDISFMKPEERAKEAAKEQRSDECTAFDRCIMWGSAAAAGVFMMMLAAWIFHNITAAFAVVFLFGLAACVFCHPLFIIFGCLGLYLLIF